MFSSFQKQDRATTTASAFALVAMLVLGLLGLLPGGAHAQGLGDAFNNYGSYGSQGWGQQKAMVDNTNGQMGWGGSSIPSNQARAKLQVKKGVVVDVQATEIEVTSSTAGRGTGALIGGLVGMVVATNSGSNGLGQALGGVVGGLLGERTANAAGKEMRQATQIIVQLDNGEVTTIVQEAGVSPFAVGDNVYLVGSADSATRVVKANVQTAANTAVNGPRP
jgi:outer membrane lipoprotein SlyB